MGFCGNGVGLGSWMGWGGGWGGMILPLAFFVGMLVLLGLGAVLLARQLRGRPVVAGTGDAPLEIAQRRLAAGDITITEYEKIHDMLQN